MTARFLRLLPGPLRRRPQLALAAALLAVTGALVLAIAAAALMTPSPAQPQLGGTATTNVSWTLSELQTHVDKGEITAIGVPGPNADNPDGLLARTSAGQVYRVATDVAPADALNGLQALGDGHLFTTGAWDAVTNGRASTSDQQSGGGDIFHTALPIVVSIALVLLLVVLMVRFTSRPMLRRRDSSSNFQTIMPAAPDANTQRTAAVATDAQNRRVDTPGGRDRVVSLEDVAGCDEAKLELTEAIEFLKTPERFRRLGASIPRGILLFGPPGTGKTMLARAVAAEAGVPFHYTSGSEFVEKYVGVGARRMRDLFNQAKKLGRGVIFVDEFDAIGKARGGTNSHEEREQTLNQLLVEMDGFSTSDDIVVIAATNRIDVLDQAVLRPGRFTRKIHVGLPDVVGRRAILDVHSRNKPLEADVDLDIVARKTYGFSGAQLADLLNEAAIFAARRSLDTIGNDELHSGWLKVAVGTGHRRSMDERERSIIAAHEVGHAICGRVHGDKRTVEEISLFAHGEALGVTVSSQEDNDLPSESDLRARLVALMGGRAAEELLFQEVTAGASNDFEKANYIASQMVTRWGMGSDPDAQDGGKSGRGVLSLFVARGNGGLPSEVQGAATRATRQILDDAYEAATETLVAEMDKLRAISSFLVEHERVDGETFAALFDGTLEVVDSTREWRPASARPRDWEEIPAYVERRHTRAPWPAELERRRESRDEDEVAERRGGDRREPRADEVPAAAALRPGRPSVDERSAVGAAPRSRPASRLRRRARSLAGATLRRAAQWLGEDESGETRRA